MHCCAWGGWKTWIAMARPGQIRDGYFPDAVFADPRYVVPVIYAALDEWINGKGGKRGSIGALLSGLARFGGLAAQVARGAKALEAMGIKPPVRISAPGCPREFSAALRLKCDCSG